MRRRSASYVLVSCGADGVRDDVDYWQHRARLEAGQQMETICGDPDADQVQTDLGFARACGK